MSSTKTFIWAVILLVLSTFYYLYDIRGERTRQEAVKHRELLLQFAGDDVTSLTIQREHETVRAEKRDGHWYLTEPLQARGDDQKYRELTHYIADLRHTRVVEEQPPSLEPYGLATPRLEIQLTLQGQATPSILRLGAANPTGGSYYAQVAGRSAVYLVSGTAQDVLDASLHAVRDKTVLDFTPAEVQAIHIGRGTDPPVILQRQAEDLWQLSAPVQAKADAPHVRGLLQRLHDVKVQTFIAEDATDLAPYGLHAPQGSVALHLGEGHAPLTLHLGDVDTARKGVYAKHAEAPRVFLLQQDVWEHMPKTASALRDKTLLRYERDHVTRLEAHTPTETIVVTSTGVRQYTLEQPVHAPGDAEVLSSWLWDIGDLKAKDFVVETPDALSLYGLEAPGWRFTVWEKAPTASEATAHHLSLGSEAPDGQGVYARLGEGPVIYLVGHAEVERLTRHTAFTLRNKKILMVSADQVHKIEVKYPTSQLTITRAGKNWKLTEPQHQAIPHGWKIDHLLYELSTLAYTQIIVDTPPADVAPYGLDVPHVQITLWQQNGAPIGSLMLGKHLDTDAAAPPTLYAQAGPQTPLYVVLATFLKSVPKTAAELTAEK